MAKPLATSFLLVFGFSFFQSFPAIAQVYSITFTSTSSTLGTAINLTPNAALPAISVGTVNVQSNSTNGFTVEAQSANDGMLKRSSGETMVYSLTYNGTEKGQLTGRTVMEDHSAIVQSCANPSGCNRDVRIAIAQSQTSGKSAGGYSDQLTFTIIAK